MRKGISPVISATLLILLTVGAGAVSYGWITRVQSGIQEQVSSQELPVSECSELKLIDVRGNGVTVSNTGCDTISSVNLFIDNQLTKYDLSTPLGPGNSTTINFGDLEAEETHEFQIALANGKTVSDVIEDCTVEEGCTHFNFTISSIELEEVVQ